MLLLLINSNAQRKVKSGLKMCSLPLPKSNNLYGRCLLKPDPLLRRYLNQAKTFVDSFSFEKEPQDAGLYHNPELVADDGWIPVGGDAHHLAGVDLTRRTQDERRSVETGS